MPGDKKKYVPDLFRLTDADFKAVGCTAEELEQVKQFNTQLDAINKTFREEWKKTRRRRILILPLVTSGSAFLPPQSQVLSYSSYGSRNRKNHDS